VKVKHVAPCSAQRSACQRRSSLASASAVRRGLPHAMHLTYDGLMTHVAESCAGHEAGMASTATVSSALEGRKGRGVGHYHMS